MQITDITGNHLTATDKRNIKALLAHDGFTFGETYKVNGRKRYSIVEAGERFEVTIRENGASDFGGTVERTYRSEFAA